jgi:hypothetical protein
MAAEIQIEEIIWLVVQFDAFPDIIEEIIVGEEETAVDEPPQSTEEHDSADAGPMDEQTPDGDEGTPPPPEPAFEYRGQVELRGDDTVFLFAQIATGPPITDFSFAGELGVKFKFADAATFAEDAVRSTLLWMAYPYVREMVSTVSSRSPQGPFFLPPLTKMPDPATVQGASPPAANEG